MQLIAPGILLLAGEVCWGKPPHVSFHSVGAAVSQQRLDNLCGIAGDKRYVGTARDVRVPNEVRVT